MGVRIENSELLVDIVGSDELAEDPQTLYESKCGSGLAREDGGTDDIEID
jgi:hypothetical protein